MNENNNDVLLKVKNLSLAFEKKEKKLFKKAEKIQILNHLNFEIKRGEIVGLVGESGCGKSTLAKAILKIHPHYEGEVVSLAKCTQMIFQDPFSSLNPAKKIGWILEEPLRNKTNLSHHERQEKVKEVLNKVGLPLKYMNHYPKELSGGQRQRVAIAGALMLSPELLIADEPVSALDVTIQQQIIELLLQLQKDLNLSIIFISHDLRVVYQICNRVMIMEKGCIVEQGDVEEIYENPKNPYTNELLQAAGISLI